MKKKEYFQIILVFISILIYGLSLKSTSFASPSDHIVNEKHSGWSYPLDDRCDPRCNKVIPTKTISFGFMSYWHSGLPYHYAQDFTIGYEAGDSVYAMAYGKIIRARKSGSYGGGDPCDSDYNTLVTMHNYFKKDGSIGKVYIFYGHLKNIINVPAKANAKELTTKISINKGQKIAELNNPLCAGFKRVHLHLTVFQDKFIPDYFDGYNDSQNRNGRVRPFDCADNENGIWSKDWIDRNKNQNIPLNDVAFFDTYEPAPPNSHMNYEACPFEGCVYREWTLLNSLRVYKSPDSKSETDFIILKGEKVNAMTGQTHLKKAGKVLITKTTIKKNNSREIILQDGDFLYLLEYFGEGFYKVWYKGEVFKIAEAWIPENWNPIYRDKLWGNLLSDLEFEWWVKIEVPSRGITGWIMNPRAKGMDRFD